ncbi:MAG: hypothetical protein JNJ99_03665 [Crocinitomicaceae bacterium]|nr:hypothetical protein [Crocinitomicaceae bacterium]
MKTTLFKTNIKKLKAATTLSNIIPLYFKGAKVEFDAMQKNFWMKITAPRVKPAQVVTTMKDLGYKFEVQDKVIVWRAE